MSNKYTTVKQLIEALQEVDGDLAVICQADSEGNGYSPLSGIDADNTFYVPDSGVRGEVVAASRAGTDAVKCLVIYPKA